MSYPIVAVQTSETFIIPSMEESIYDVADWIERYIDNSVATAAENRNVQSIEAEIDHQLFNVTFEYKEPEDENALGYYEMEVTPARDTDFPEGHHLHRHTGNMESTAGHQLIKCLTEDIFALA